MQSYKKLTLELQRADLSSLPRNARLAFFINVYNALVIHGTVEKGRPRNMLTKFMFFKNTAYNIGGQIYSLNEMENGILRANRCVVRFALELRSDKTKCKFLYSRSMGTFFLTPFSSDDPRLALALEKPEPRIHFALNCGAKSCPPIKTYSTENVSYAIFSIVLRSI